MFELYCVCVCVYMRVSVCWECNQIYCADCFHSFSMHVSVQFANSKEEAEEGVQN